MAKTTLTWAQEITARQEHLVIRRRDFHRHPELSFQEHRTAEIVAECLHKAGLEVRTGIAETGVVGILYGDKPGRTIAWRADMDALPLNEKLDLPFASSMPDVMHACGHDGHTAIALTLAEMLAAHRAEMFGTAVFLFQPAEETGSIRGGAKAMIDARVLEEPRVEEVYGLHLHPQLATGRVAVWPGPAMASNDSFEIEVEGKGGHAGRPHLSVDPIPIVAHLVLGLQHLISHETAAQDTAVLTIGQLLAGTKHNIIPDSAVLRGTLRTFSPSVREQILARLDTFVDQIARAYRATAQFMVQGDGCPVVVNHPGSAAHVERCATHVLGPDAVLDETFLSGPSTANDDMSRFLQARPGCYFFVGVAPETGTSDPVHSPRYLMNEDGLSIGLRVALRVMQEALGDAE